MLSISNKSKKYLRKAKQNAIVDFLDYKIPVTKVVKMRTRNFIIFSELSINIKKKIKYNKLI